MPLKIEPATNALSITPSDTVNLTEVARAIYVGGAGDVVAIIGGNAITFAGAQAGTILPITCSRINSTSTTATNLVALY